MKVKYQGKVYKVLASKHLGDCRLYKLKSQFSGGSPFGALKKNCKTLAEGAK